MSSFDIYLDNVSCVREKQYPVRRPDIVTPKRNYKEYDIPGRDGKYFEDLGTYDDITFNINFNFKEKREYLNKTFRDYKRMIRKSKTLMMMDDSEIFYKIKKVEFGDISRESTKEINAFVATFTCDPYGYLLIGQDRYDFEHNITPDTRPKCLLCNNDRKFINVSLGYHSAYCEQHVLETKQVLQRTKRSYRCVAGYLQHLTHCTKSVIRYRSLLECTVYTALEQIDCTYEVEPFRIYFEQNNKKHYYLPDVLVHYNNYHILVEIKLAAQFNTTYNQAKFNLAKQYVETSDTIDIFVILTHDKCDSVETIKQFLDNTIANI